LEHDVYRPVAEALPSDGRIDSRIVHMDFMHPYRSISSLVRRFGTAESVIVDITAASTEVKANVIISLPMTDLRHVCYLALSDDVYKRRGKDQPGHLLYHDLTSLAGQRLYSYHDIATAPTSRWARMQMKSRDVLASSLLVLSTVLMVAVVVLIGVNRAV